MNKKSFLLIAFAAILVFEIACNNCSDSNKNAADTTVSEQKDSSSDDGFKDLEKKMDEISKDKK